MQPTETFTLSCDLGGPLATFSAPLTPEGVLEALRGLPVPARYGLSENVMHCLADRVARHPTAPARYGLMLTLTAGAL